MKKLLKMDLMMFGRVRRSRTKKDAEGNKVLDKYDKNGKPVYKKEKYWDYMKEENGDVGLFPSVNHIYVRKGKQMYYTELADRLYDKWINQAELWVRENEAKLIEEKVYIDYYFVMPNDNRVRDTHNVLKMNLDSMTGIIFKDDHKALPRIMDYRKCTEGESPHIEIVIQTKAEYDSYIEGLKSNSNNEPKH